MLRNRLCYGLVLLGTSLFFLCYDGYLSYYVFFLSLLLPLFSLVLSLPGMLLLRLELSLSGPDPALGRCRKGEAATLRLTARCPWFLTGSRVKLRLTVKNTLTGERRREWLVFSPSREPLTIEHQVASPHCGLVECSLSRGKCCDLLGLFTLPLRLKKAPPCRVYFFPAVYRPALALGEQPLPDGEGDKYSPHKPGDDPTELFGLRPYREGDRLSRIHWKLSQKTGQTLVKELGLPVSERVLFLCRAFYFLGVLRGGEAYRNSLACDAEAELPEPLPFELDDFSAADFADGLLELKPEDRDKLLELLGLRIANGGAVEAVRVVSESDTEFPDFEEEA